MATIGTVTYPTDTTWEVEVTLAPAETTSVVVSDGTDTVPMTVDGPTTTLVSTSFEIPVGVHTLQIRSSVGTVSLGDITVAEALDLTLTPNVAAIPTPINEDPIIIVGTVPSFLQGALSVAYSTSANLIVPKPLAGSLLSSVSLASSIVVPKPLAAALSIAATTSADLTVEVPLDVTTMPFVNAITSPTSDNPIIITGYVPGGVLELAGTLYAQTTLEGSLTVLKPLFGSININTSIYGDLTVTPASFLSGVVGIQVSSSGSLSVPKPLAGQISISVNVLHHMKTVRFRVKSVIKDVASDFSVPITIQKP